jgi:allantoate deiminase
MAHLDELARCTSESGKLTRLYLTPAHQAAIRMVRGWMEEAGMAVEVDAAANVVGRYPGQRLDAPALLLGSHIDTVRDAGRYDGNLGVLAAIEAVAALHATYMPPASACPSRSRCWPSATRRACASRAS